MSAVKTVAGYIYRICRKAGMTIEAICALLAQIQKESRFIVNNVEDGRGWTDDEYTRAVDNGTYNGFCSDRIGYGIYQLTEPSRKTNFWNFTQIRKQSIGDLDNQVAFLLWEMYKQFPSIWAQMMTSHDLEGLTWTLLDKWENPNEKEKNYEERLGYARAWLEKAKALEASGELDNEDDDAAQEQSQQQSGDAAIEAAIGKVLALAKSEVDYREKANNQALDVKDGNAGSGNFTKYARDLDAEPTFYNGKKQGFAWCDVFFDWLFKTCFGAYLAMRMLCQPQNSAGAGCSYSAQYYKTAGRWTRNPQPGDQIFFFDDSGQINHTGIVESVDGTTVTTIEGNSGDRVARRQYDINSGYIAGYGRPLWELAVESLGPQQTSTAPVYNVAQANININMILKLGDTGDSVRVMQEHLLKTGYDVGPDGADGDFGKNTLAALKQYQKDRNLSECGYFGQKTFEAMKKESDAAKATVQPAVTTAKPSTPTQQQPAAKKLAFKVGDKVMFYGKKQYTSAQSDRSRACNPGKAKVTKVSAGAKHPYYVVRILLGGSNVMGWVNEEDLEAI